MNAHGSPILRLEQYLNALSKRFRRLHYVIAAAALTGAVLVLTVLGVYFAMRQGFSAWIINTVRALMLLAVMVLILWLLVWPLRKLRRNTAQVIGRRTPDFDGRIEAFNKARDQNNPFTELLAEDTLQVADRFPVEQTIKPRELGLPLIIAAAAVMTLLWLAVAGPGLWSYGTRYLWAGWAVSNLKPAQSILVKPGDQVVRRGGNVPVMAQMQGFAPVDASVYVQMSDGQWQQVAMTRTDEGFAFTFFSVRDALRYYIAAAGVRSQDYSINVIDLPSITNLKLTYTFPRWTGRKPEVQDPGGDVSALKDTQIDLEISADAPLPGVELVLDEQAKSLSTEGTKGTTSFPVEKAGRYYLAARVAGEQVRLSDDYFIRVLDDAKPEIKVSKPGRDYGASGIEEVITHVDASDDVGLDAVELHYAVNGASWQTVELERGKQKVSADHLFAMESLGAKDAALKPGDVVSYYAVARDHTSSVRTDMYFIDVRPFDLRFTQSQRSAGQGQGQQGEQQGEISQRQREIVVSTWNLIREQEEKSADRAQIEDNSKLLSELQTKLAAQATSLAERMAARNLDTSDSRGKEFADNIKQAITAMTPAAINLNKVKLDDAIQPEQQALQYILRAEAVFNEIQVQQQAQGQGGQGGQQQDSRDMAQMYELEMDITKNQYEARNNASPEQQTQTQDELEQKLKELARRQQQLANNTRQQQQLTQEQRWQQESLKREAEQLQQQIQNLQQQAQQSQQGQQAQQGQQGQQSQQSQQSGQQGQQTAQQRAASQAANSQTQELQQRLQSAIRAMDESSNAMRNGSDASERARAQRAAAEAQRQLSGAGEAVARNQQQTQQNSLSNLSDQSSRLYEEQAQFDRKLQDAVKQMRGQSQSDVDAIRPEPTGEEKQLANEKRTIATRLQELRRDMVTAQRNLKEQAPQTAAQIAEAAESLDENKIEQRMSVAAMYIDQGGAPYVVASESMVTDTLRQLRDSLRDASAQGAGTGASNDKANEAVAQVRALRQQLEQLTSQQRAAQNNAQSGNQPGSQSNGAQGNAQNSSQRSGQSQGQGTQQSQQNQANGQSSGQGMQAGQSQQTQANSQAGGQGMQGAQGQGQGQQGQSGGQGMQAGQGGAQGQVGGVSGNEVGPSGQFANAGGTPRNLNSNLNNTLNSARAAITELNQRGRIGQQEAQQLQDLTRQLESMRLGATSGDAANRASAESTALALVEQLELKLAQASERAGKTKQTVRSAVAEPVPADYEEAVAEYYRRLSKGSAAP